MINKIDVDLTGVPQTLLLPLAGRAKFSREAYSPIKDQKALQLVDALNYDFHQLQEQAGSSSLIWMARAIHFDEAVKSYLNIFPHAVIVNLGAGLETAYYRTDNGKLTWVDLDLLEVITLRKKLLPLHERVHHIAKSILDYSWMQDVLSLGKNIFFLAGGLFMYFKEEQVKSLFLAMAKHFPQSQLIFDSCSRDGLARANKMLIKSNMSGAVLQWGTNNAKEIEAWSNNIKILADHSYFKNLKANFPLSIKLKMLVHHFLNKGGIIHLQFL